MWKDADCRTAWLTVTTMSVRQTLSLCSEGLTFLSFSVFLPPTLVSGIMGMNFSIFPQVGVFPEGVEVNMLPLAQAYRTSHLTPLLFFA